MRAGTTGGERGGAAGKKAAAFHGVVSEICPGSGTGTLAVPWRECDSRACEAHLKTRQYQAFAICQNTGTTPFCGAVMVVRQAAGGKYCPIGMNGT